MEIFLILLLALYAIINIRVTKKIDEALYLNEKSRKLHKKIIWILPFLGALLTKDSWQEQKGNDIEITTKSSKKINKSSFYESGQGIHG